RNAHTASATCSQPCCASLQSHFAYAGSRGTRKRTVHAGSFAVGTPSRSIVTSSPPRIAKRARSRRLGPSDFSSAASSISAGDHSAGTRAEEGGGAPSSSEACQDLYASATATRCLQTLEALHEHGESLSVFPAKSFAIVPSANFPITVPSSVSSRAGPLPSAISR